MDPRTDTPRARSAETDPDDAERNPPSPEHELVLQGSGSWFPVADLIGILGSARKSGVLRVRTDHETFTVELEGGDIVHCESTRPSAGQRLGDILVMHGFLSRATLEAAIAAPSPERLGARLLRTGTIAREHLAVALRTQIQVLFCHLVRERSRRFAFWVGPPLHAGVVRLSVVPLLLEGARVNDEFADGLRWLEDGHAPEPAGV